MTPITERDLPEEVMTAALRLEEEAYRAGQHGCCEENGPKENPSCWKACEVHGPRCRAALSLLCHALAQFTERIVMECAGEVERVRKGLPYRAVAPSTLAALHEAAETVHDLAPRCEECKGRGFTHGGHGAPPCDCSRGTAWAHWRKLDANGAEGGTR